MRALQQEKKMVSAALLGTRKGSSVFFKASSSPILQNQSQGMLATCMFECVRQRAGNLFYFSSLRQRISTSTSPFDQNMDRPFDMPQLKKKPFLRPLTRASKNTGKEEQALHPPANGLLAPKMIQVAQKAMKSWFVLLAGAKALLEVFPIKGCRYCSAVHVGAVGHTLAFCHGPHNAARHGLHDWVEGDIEDLLPSMEVFHLSDRLGKSITHEERHLIDRVPAVVELCIQAGVDIPGYPTKRRTKPVVIIGEKVFDCEDFENIAGGRVRMISRDMKLRKFKEGSLDFGGNAASYIDFSKEKLAEAAQKTLQAWCAMRNGAKKLMTMYSVHVCGYCSQLHVGPRGSRTRDCTAHKHQQRGGYHGWQEASVDDLIPPKYVWHVCNPNGPPLTSELRAFYGVAPAIVELCVQAGADVPEDFKAMMRVDVAIPDLSEIDKVA